MNLTAKITASLVVLALTGSGAFAARMAPDQSEERGLLIEPASRQVPVRLAQATDTVYRIGQLEERIRVLNGRIEELSFQLLEMQERMRKMQQDNEFRFQELEGGAVGDQSDAGDAGNAPDTGNQRRVVVLNPGAASSGTTLGELTVDQNGELVGQDTQEQDATQTASLPAAGAEEPYRVAYGHILAGNYEQAEAGFESFIAEHPDSPRLSDAHFWLGEAQYSQGAYHEAAKTLLSAHKQYPSSQKSPEILLKLGMALAALDNRDTACATYREVLVRYPDVDEVVKNKVVVEQSRMNC